MFSLRKPSVDALRRMLAAQRTLEFTYPMVGATASEGRLPDGYRVDHNRALLGVGSAAFDRARAALARWEQFRLGWLEAWPGDTPLRAGETVAVVAWAAGLWCSNVARIVYTIDEPATLTGPARFGFAYGTLPAHVAAGEERFLVEWDRQTDQVWFDILAFSRPRHWLVRLNPPLARATQKRFAKDAMAAMQRAVQGSQPTRAAI